MNWKAIALGAMACFASSGPALAVPGAFHVRNETGQVLTCGLRRARGSMNDVFVVRPGADWTQATPEATPRLLRCDVNRLPLQARIQPGVDYVLAEDQSGMVVLRAATRVRTAAPASRPGTRCSAPPGARANNPAEIRRFTVRPTGAAGGARVLLLQVEAADPDGDALIYTYSTTSGRIVGEGPEVLWTVSEPGPHTATVELDDRRGCVTFGSVSDPG